MIIIIIIINSQLKVDWLMGLRGSRSENYKTWQTFSMIYYTKAKFAVWIVYLLNYKKYFPARCAIHSCLRCQRNLLLHLRKHRPSQDFSEPIPNERGETMLSWTWAKRQPLLSPLQIEWNSNRKSSTYSPFLQMSVGYLKLFYFLFNSKMFEPYWFCKIFIKLPEPSGLKRLLIRFL